MELHYIRQRDHNLEEVTATDPFQWLNVFASSIQDLDPLIKQYQLPRVFLMDLFDPDEVSRSEINDAWYCIVLRVPVELPEEDIPYRTLPLGVLISDKLILTICSQPTTTVLNIGLNAQTKLDISKSTNFMLHLFYRTAYFFLLYLSKIHHEIERLEKELLASIENKEIVSMLRLQKSLVYITTALKSNNILLEKLLKTRFGALNAVDTDQYDDVIIENRQALEVAEIYNDILTGMMDAFASIISNNLNVVMKLLTSLTILLTIPMLVVSVFGMNVPIPYQNSVNALTGIAVTAIALTLVGIYYFRKKKFL